MGFSDLILAFISVVGISIGQILFKKASHSLTLSPNIHGFFSLCHNLYFICALVLYGSCTLVWIALLSNVKLNQAYAFMGFVFIIVPLLSYFFLKETITTKQVIGYLVITLGVILVA